MIDIINLNKIVNEGFAKDFGSGYSNSDEFNQKVELAQSILLGYYTSLYPRTINSQKAISPLVKEVGFPNNIDEVANELPSDYTYHISAVLYRWEKVGCETKRLRDNIIWNATPENIDAFLLSPIRGTEPWYVLQSGGVVFYNTSGKEPRLKYIGKYTEAKLVTTIDNVSRQEIPDVINSVDLGWNETFLNEFVNLLLFFKGVELRDERLLTYIQTNNLYNEENN